MTRNRILMTCAIASLALGLSACSSSDDGPVTMMPDAPMVVGMVVPTGAMITLPADLLDDKTYEAAEGDTVTFDDVGAFKCLSATCTVVVENDVITTTGDIQVVSLVDDLPAEALTALADVAEDPPAELTPLEEAAAAAVVAERERLLTELEVADIRGAIAAANALMATLSNDSDDNAIAAVRAAIMAASDAVQNAARLTDAQTGMYTTHVMMAGLRLDAAEARAEAARALARTLEAEGEIQAVADAKMGVTTALADLGMAMTDRTAAHDALLEAQAAVTTAGDALGTTDDPAVEVAAYTAAKMIAEAAQADYVVKTDALTDARAALYAANMTLAEVAPEAAELAIVQAALEAAQIAAANAEKAAEEAAKIQTDRIAELEKAEADRVAEADAKAHTDMSKRIATAVGAFMPDDGMSMDVDADTITKDGAIGTKDFVADPAGPPAITGWQGLLSKNEQRADTTIIAAYTNIKAPTSTAFSTKYDEGDAGVEAEGIYVIGTDGLMWGSVAKTAAGKTIANLGEAGDLGDNNFEGTYDGLPGTFVLTDDAWTFTLDDPNATVSIKDEDFLAFGWWKEVPTTGVIGFEPFAFGTVGFDADPAALEDETATYEGPAAGLWASRNIVADKANYGKFTAEVELTAYFDGADNSRIGGKVDGFADENGDVLGDWQVTLLDRKLDAMEGAGTAAGTYAGINNTPGPEGLYAYEAPEMDAVAALEERAQATSFGGARGTSNWAGRFWGNRKSDDLPAAVTGTFAAGVGAALSLSGAFAAENTEADE